MRTRALAAAMIVSGAVVLLVSGTAGAATGQADATATTSTTSSTSTSSTTSSTTTSSSTTSSTSSTTSSTSTSTSTSTTSTTEAPTTTTTAGFFGGPLAKEGDDCTVDGMVAHSAEGEMLICHVVGGSSVLGASTTRPTTTTVKPAVKDATVTRASSDSLPLTGARSMTTALIAVMVMSAGVVLWGRATKKEYDRNWVARHAEPYRPVPPSQGSDDRWHW